MDRHCPIEGGEMTGCRARNEMDPHPIGGLIYHMKSKQVWWYELQLGTCWTVWPKDLSHKQSHTSSACFSLLRIMPLSHQRAISVRFIFTQMEKNGICLFVGKRADITFRLISTRIRQNNTTWSVPKWFLRLKERLRRFVCRSKQERWLVVMSAGPVSICAPVCRKFFADCRDCFQGIWDRKIHFIARFFV